MSPLGVESRTFCAVHNVCCAYRWTAVFLSTLSFTWNFFYFLLKCQRLLWYIYLSSKNFAVIDPFWTGDVLNIFVSNRNFVLKIYTTLGYIVSLILLNLGHVFRFRIVSRDDDGLVRQYNQELCISLNSRCFTKRLQSRSLNRNCISKHFLCQVCHVRLQIKLSTADLIEGLLAFGFVTANSIRCFWVITGLRNRMLRLPHKF